MNPPLLIPRKTRITSISTIIHIIMNRIRPGAARTRILLRIARTPIRTLRLGRRIPNIIPTPATRVPLERMQQPQPVARLVHRRLAHIVPVDGALRDGAERDVAAVAHVHGGRGVGADVGRERADAEIAARRVGLEVEVQVFVGALAQGALHGDVDGVVAADGPGVVDGPGGVAEVEGHAVGVVRVVQRGQLLRHLRGGDHVGVGFGGHDVQVHSHRDGASGGGVARGT